jgi:hydroxyethylthiazole kinase
MQQKILTALATLKTTKPLVLNVTNYVTMDFMANALLAVGAAPIMTVCDEELAELINIASSININIGTLDKLFIERCYQAVQLAKQYQKPVILDPVGAGATLIRTQVARDLLESADIIRGNASEIIALTATTGDTLGVESTHTTVEAKATARALAKQYGATVVVSGPVDFVADSEQEIELPFGSALMPYVTGMGCTLTAVIAAFRAVIDNSFEAAQLATAYYGTCGQRAASKASTPGGFRTAFIDQLFMDYLPYEI